MPDRTRPIRKEICLNEQELSMVRHKMNHAWHPQLRRVCPENAD